MRSMSTLTRADLADAINRKLGFSRALGPQGSAETAGVRQMSVARLADAVARIGDEAWDDARR